jgi:hypothetical protein
LNRAKLTGVEEFAKAYRTRLVPDSAGPAVQHPNHWLVASWTVHAPLVIPAYWRGGARRIEEVDTCFRMHIALFESVEPETFTRCASIDLCFFDVHCLHRRAALGTLDLLHECPHASLGGYQQDDYRLHPGND